MVKWKTKNNNKNWKKETVCDDWQNRMSLQGSLESTSNFISFCYFSSFFFMLFCDLTASMMIYFNVIYLRVIDWARERERKKHLVLRIKVLICEHTAFSTSQEQAHNRFRFYVPLNIPKIAIEPSNVLNERTCSARSFWMKHATSVLMTNKLLFITHTHTAHFDQLPGLEPILDGRFVFVVYFQCDRFL